MMNIGTFIACQNAMNTARNAMFSSMKGKGDTSFGSSSSKGDSSSSETSHKIRNIIILFACFLFFVWCNFLAIYGLCQRIHNGFAECAFLGTMIFVMDVAYWALVYIGFQISKC